MRRTSFAAVVLAVGAAVLTACGGGDDDGSGKYCTALKDMGSGSYVRNIANSESAGKMRKVAEVSPADIKADWLKLAEWQEQAMKSADAGDIPNAQLDTSALERIVAYNEKTCMK
ncbi:hypothetical protein AB0H76_14955 [Nocardia sp. NPDC050712]|uniref:hypothetical protein n=1 Tax=Nocardia sp. NPDC050712 TaxID=3155518 RepID=UPI003409572E